MLETDYGDESAKEYIFTEETGMMYLLSPLPEKAGKGPAGLNGLVVVQQVKEHKHGDDRRGW